MQLGTFLVLFLEQHTYSQTLGFFIFIHQSYFMVFYPAGQNMRGLVLDHRRSCLTPL